jgi:hypothetical protein
MSRTKNYRIFRLSAFIFRTPEQCIKFARQLDTLEKEFGCGLELVALRRGYNGRRTGSISSLAAELFQMIKDGKHRILREFNVDKLHPEIQKQAIERSAKIAHARLTAKAALRDQILLQATLGEADLAPTAILISNDCLDFLCSHR